MLGSKKSYFFLSPQGSAKLATMGSAAAHLVGASSGFAPSKIIPNNAALSSQTSLKRTVGCEDLCADPQAQSTSHGWQMLEKFTTLSVIGTGSSSKVLLVKQKGTGELMALKILNKKSIEERKQEEEVYLERRILTEITHPFIVGFKGSFQTEKKLYFLLEYCPGGDLYKLLDNHGRLAEEAVRMYVAQILLALEYLHSKGILYRDLRPENILLDKNGFIRLTDFGVSTFEVDVKADTGLMTGAPEYLSPEVIQRQPYNRSSDFWGLGCLAYEMLVGMPPFNYKDKKMLMEMIKTSTPGYPSFLTPNARAFLEGLLTKDPTARFGVERSKSHPWMSDIEWDRLLCKKVTAPILPIIKSETDLQNFEPEVTQMAINSPNVEPLSASFKNYQGFSYDPLQLLVDDAQET